MHILQPEHIKDYLDVADKRGLLLSALVVDATVFQQLLVELLQIVGSQLGEFDIADAGNSVLLDHQLVAIGCGDADVWLGVDVIPASQPCGNGILIRAADVDTLD